MTSRPRVPTFTLPESFDAREFLRKPELMRRMADANYFVSTILRRNAHGLHENGIVRLYAKFLKNIMHQRFYSATIDSLLTGGVVERFPYLVGERSFGFRLAERYFEDKHVRVPITDERLLRRLDIFYRQSEQERRGTLKPVHFALERQQQRLRIYGDSARGIIAIGNIAVGVFSSGGVAIGGVTFGGCSLGLFSCGGFALALLLAVGGFAAGGIALGGFSAGYYAYGGAAFGVHTLSSTFAF